MSGSNGIKQSWWKTLLGRTPMNGHYLLPYRRLALQLHNELPRTSHSRTVLLVTPTTSTISAHATTALARSFGEEMQSSIMLVDACPGRPQLTGVMGASEKKGFVESLMDPSRSIDEFLLPTSCEQVRFLPAGIGGDRRWSVESIGNFIRAAEQQSDFVIIDGGAILDDPTALALVPYVGCVLLTATESETKMEELEMAKKTLALCKASKVALLLARQDHEVPGSHIEPTRESSRS